MRLTAARLKPVTLILLDGKEYQFRPSAGDLQELCERFQVDNLDDLMKKQITLLGTPLLYCGLLNKGELHEKEFARLVPMHIQWLNEAIPLVIGAVMPPPDPPEANLTV